MENSAHNGSRLDEDEKYFIEKKMEAAGWTNFRSFVLNHIGRGEIVKLDIAEIREMTRLLRNVSNNINQISAQVNSTGRVYDTDITEIQTQQAALWEQQNKIIAVITKMTEGK